MKYRLMKLTQGTEIWYEIHEWVEFNWLGKLLHGISGIWELCYGKMYCGAIKTEGYFSYYDEEKAKLKFVELEQDYLNDKCEIKEEILREC